ncbi:uncharacterized protein LOC26529082 isoform X1 [Drosophila willistoni]|uniref:uncharacterized protein LOC26529082 isoform X1 n=1 Tax=Drosophila willistoni TaxID=7260 RepID=UPI000C26D1C7|nr:uncharacterized protein LOC26529082 isoform X1 [Drosophila willistoni]
MCLAQKCCCGCELKTGCWVLAGLQIGWGTLQIISAICLKSSDESDRYYSDDDWLFYYPDWKVYLTIILALLSILGGVLITIALSKGMRWPLQFGTVLGYPLAIFNLIPLCWQIYLTVVLCSYIEETNIN